MHVDTIRRLEDNLIHTRECGNQFRPRSRRQQRFQRIEEDNN
jgi:hypothetical protein